MSMRFIKYLAAALAFSTSFSVATAGEFSGELKLYPVGCQNTDARLCKLGSKISYKSSHDNLTWQAETWTDSNSQNGTTDGASIPPWAQPIIGDAYNPKFLKPAIIHDHYCYKENQVRTWRQTHRMFYDGLIDSGVSSAKAKIMYFAVYWRGPRWIKLVPGQNCGTNCINNVTPGGHRWEGDRYTGEKFKAELLGLQADLATGKKIEIGDIEKRAQALDPGNFFFKHGGTYAPTGPNDPNLNPNL